MSLPVLKVGDIFTESIRPYYTWKVTYIYPSDNPDEKVTACDDILYSVDEILMRSQKWPHMITNNLAPGLQCHGSRVSTYWVKLYTNLKFKKKDYKTRRISNRFKEL